MDDKGKIRSLTRFTVKQMLDAGIPRTMENFAARLLDNTGSEVPDRYAAWPEEDVTRMFQALDGLTIRHHELMGKMEAVFDGIGHCETQADRERVLNDFKDILEMKPRVLAELKSIEDDLLTFSQNILAEIRALSSESGQASEALARRQEELNGCHTIWTAKSILSSISEELSTVRTVFEGTKDRLGTIQTKFEESQARLKTMTERIQEKEQLAEIDPLTGVLNRRGFERRIEALPMAWGSIMVLDLDHFKAVNDSHGHHAGDYVLIECARLVSRHLDREDILARFGGEEFVVALPEKQIPAAKLLAERIRQAVASYHFLYDECPIGITISIGIDGMTHHQRDGEFDFTAAYKGADSALFSAKRAGRNRVMLAKGALTD